jgi:hypothetical protein
VDELGPVGARQAWVVIAHRCCADEIRSVLAANDFAEVTFPGLSDYPAEESERAKARIAQIGEESEHLLEHGAKLSADHYDQTVALVQAIESERDRLVVRREFARTDKVFAISGWVREDGAEHLNEVLAPFADVDLTLEEPTEEDSPPIELDNPKWLRPLEVLTDLYGRPQYDELDPTILLAPFFLAFFGICISDVGYGAMIIVAGYLIKTRLDVAPGVKRFCDLLMYGGVFAMGFGVAFASYFALPVASLPPLLQDLQVLDPLNELPTFLLFTSFWARSRWCLGCWWLRTRPGRHTLLEVSSARRCFVQTIAAMVMTGNGQATDRAHGTMLMQVGHRSCWRCRGTAVKRGLGVAWLLAASGESSSWACRRYRPAVAIAVSSIQPFVAGAIRARRFSVFSERMRSTASAFWVTS